jgi:hypothetical protein
MRAKDCGAGEHRSFSRMKTQFAKTVLLLVLLALTLAFGYFCAVRTVDFRAYHGAARQVLSGDFDLYRLESVRRALTFRYAPVIVFLFIPFAFLPVKAAAFIWFLLNAAALAYVVQLSMKLAGVESGPYAKVFFLAFLAAAGYLVEELRIGNAHIIVIFLLVFSFYLIRKGKVLVPSVLIALAVLTKVVPLLFLFYYGLKKKVVVCLVIILSLFVLMLVPAIPFGFRTNLDLLKDWGRSMASRFEEPVNHSLKGVLFKYLTRSETEDPKYPRVNVLELSGKSVERLWLFLAGVLVLVLAAGLLKSREGPTAALLECSLLVTSMLILSPHDTRIYYSSLFVPCTALVIFLLAYPKNPYRRIVQAALCITFAVGTLLPVVLPGRNRALAYEACSPYFFSALLIFAVLLVLIFRFERIERAGSGTPAT